MRGSLARASGRCVAPGKRNLLRSLEHAWFGLQEAR
jgi:hypothetical protein